MEEMKKKYKVSTEDLDILKPEETLIDSVSSHSKIEVPIERSVFTVFYIITALALAFYMIDILKLQAMDGGHYLAVLKNSNSSRYYSTPVRGIIYDRNKQPLVENIPTFSLIGVPGEITRLDGPEAEKTINQIADLTSLSHEYLAVAYRDNKKKSIFYVKNDLSKEEVLSIKNLNPSGFYVVYDSLRHYVSGQASAHLIGYTSKVTSADLSDDYYRITDRIGRFGLEAGYENELRGDRRAISLNDKFIQEEASPGESLYLNVDEMVQEKLTEALRGAGVTRGAAVAQDPGTGAVLGLVSFPPFDNNIFETGDDQKINALLKNSNRPLFNRVIGGKYSPGSTIKPLLALAGLKEKVVTPETTIFANGSITVRSIYDPSVTYQFNDWRVHGLTDLRKAIADSVDIYFYALGGGYGSIRGLGIDNIEKYFKIFRIDSLTGIDLPGETTGFIPGPIWKENFKGESWYIGDTYNVSIGQGDLVVTPIWLNTYIGAIANGGKLMRPNIVDSIIDSNGKTVKKIQPSILGEIPFDESTIKIVREGMRQTVTAGTATLLNSLPVSVAAKTGTAQAGKRGLNSLFTVFGPFDNPRINLTVLVENVQGSQGMAIRVANDFLSWYFTKSN